MAKVFTFLIMIAGLMILFNLAGMPTTIGFILDKFGIIDTTDGSLTPEGINLSTLVLIIQGILVAAVTTGIAIGYITKSPTETYLLAPYAGVLLLFVSDLTFVIHYLSTGPFEDWIVWIVVLIMLPITAGYIHAVVSWWSGKE